MGTLASLVCLKLDFLTANEVPRMAMGLGREGRCVMTWWTGAGHVTMPKPVIDLMAETAMALREEIVSEIRDEDPDLHPHVGVPVFDSLDHRTQVFALAYVLRHLSEPDLPSPSLYAWNEGTAWAIFVKAGDELEIEFEFEKDADVDADLWFRFRHLIREALKAVDPSARRTPAPQPQPGRLEGLPGDDRRPRLLGP